MTPPAGSSPWRPWLRRTSVVEVASLAVLLGNRASLDVDALSALVGPVHGTAYLATIALAALASPSAAARALAWVPVVGGLLALRLSRPARPAPPPDSPPPPPVPTAPAAGPVDAAVTATGLTKRYRSGATVGPLDLAVPRGTVTGLIGPNGAGKTTVIRMLLGLVRPTAGEIRIRHDGRETSDLAHVGALVEQPALVAGLSGRRNLLAVAALAGWSRDDVDPALDLVGLADAGSTPVSAYSLGMRQRLALAVALLHRPSLLVLDEPANGLDPAGIVELRRLLRTLADGGATVLVSSHQLSEVSLVCDRLVLLDRGAVVHDGDTRALLDSAATVLVRPLDAARVGEVAEAVLRSTGERPVVTGDAVRLAGDAATASRVMSALVGHGTALAEVRVERPTLEEVFFAATAVAGPDAGRRGLAEVRTGGR